MEAISLNGTMLHDVQMLMEPYQKGAISSLRYPKSRIRFTLEEQIIRLWFPAMLALELYRIGTLPQDENGECQVRIGDKNVGNYRIIDFRYPGARIGHTDDILMVLAKVETHALR